MTYGTQDGEVQTMLETPDGVIPSLVENRTGNQKWTWIASFEAFDAGPRANVVGGQVPNGTYRFLVKGKIHTGGAVKPYQLASAPFTVSPWKGLTGSLAVKGSTAVFTPEASTTRAPTARRSPSSATTWAASPAARATPTPASSAGPAASGPGPRAARSRG